MNAKVENTTAEQSVSPVDYAIILAGALILAAGIFAFYYFDPAWPVWVRVLTVVSAIIAGFYTASRSLPGKQFKGFVDASIVEMRKVVWPTRQETLQTTGVVVVAVIVVGILLFIIDYLLAALVRLTMG